MYLISCPNTECIHNLWIALSVFVYQRNILPRAEFLRIWWNVILEKQQLTHWKLTFSQKIPFHLLAMGNFPAEIQVHMNVCIQFSFHAKKIRIFVLISSFNCIEIKTAIVITTNYVFPFLECGVRPVRRQPRNFKPNQFYYNDRIPKIIAGSPTREGQFPWQASLELLHPSMGFLGHWCGGVLIDQYWILSAAHCVHKYENYI